MKNSQNNNNSKISGFTLLELVIVISVLSIITTAVIVLIDPMQQIYKAQDARRKQDLATLNKVFEDWYNDKNYYPKPTDICYNTLSSSSCPICGTNVNSPSFKPYLGQLPCDPQSSSTDYTYVVNDPAYPTKYQIYSKLSITSDPASCGNCGLGGTGYQYGVSSSNTTP